MKIAMVSEHASPLAVLGGADAGGQNVHVAALAEAMAARGHHVVVYTRRDSPRLPERVEMTPRVCVEHLDAGPAKEIPKDDLLPYVQAMAGDLRRRLAADPPGVVHAHFWMSGLAAWGATRPLGIPFVQTFHALGSVKRREQGKADTSPPSRVANEQQICSTAARIIASCTDEIQELVAIGAARERIDVIPSGVDLSLFTPDGPVAGRRTRHRLLAVGRLVPRKGVDDAIRALRWIPETELLIAGGPDVRQLDDDPEVLRLRRVAAESGVTQRVRFLGCLDHSELPRLIRSADAVVCLPWYEPFGIVPLEAMACGVPVVGTAVGGLLDTVGGAGLGLLVPPHRPKTAARAIRQLLENEKLRRALGRSGREWAQSFAWSSVAERTERSYLRAIEPESTPAHLEERVR